MLCIDTNGLEAIAAEIPFYQSFLNQPAMFVLAFDKASDGQSIVGDVLFDERGDMPYPLLEGFAGIKFATNPEYSQLDEDAFFDIISVRRGEFTLFEITQVEKDKEKVYYCISGT